MFDLRKDLDATTWFQIVEASLRGHGIEPMPSELQWLFGQGKTTTQAVDAIKRKVQQQCVSCSM